MKFYFKKHAQGEDANALPTLVNGSSFETEAVVATTVNQHGHMVIWLNLTVEELLPTETKYQMINKVKTAVGYSKYEKLRTPLMITLTETDDIDRYLEMTNGPVRNVEPTPPSPTLETVDNPQPSNG